jgi:hypothetical protein
LSRATSLRNAVTVSGLPTSTFIANLRVMSMFGLLNRLSQFLDLLGQVLTHTKITDVIEQRIRRLYFGTWATTGHVPSEGCDGHRSELLQSADRTLDDGPPGPAVLFGEGRIG